MGLVVCVFRVDRMRLTHILERQTLVLPMISPKATLFRTLLAFEI